MDARSPGMILRKIGRNEPCPCGSGRKFKKCHIDRLDELIPQDAIDHMKVDAAERAILEAKGIRMNFVRPIVFRGQKVWAIRNRIYYNRPPRETFHEFILFILQQNLGKKWWEEQLVATEKHYIMQCFEAYRALVEASAEKQPEDAVRSVDMDGPTKYLIALAFDVASLQNAQPIPEQLLKRLRHRDQFQGARYELGIAALFVRLGFEVTFLDGTTSPSQRHCEFVARKAGSGLEIAVETKSRHRRGVLHTPGSFDEAAAVRGDVDWLLKDALLQAPGDRPYLIFIDLNSPVAVGAERVLEKRHGDLKEMLQGLIDAEPTQIAVATAIFGTNFSYHYQGGKATGHEVSEFIASRPQHPIRDKDFFADLARALQNYGSVPSFDVGGVLGETPRVRL